MEFVQADLTKPAHIERAFKTVQFDFVVNLAAETRYGQPNQVALVFDSGGVVWCGCWGA